MSLDLKYPLPGDRALVAGAARSGIADVAVVWAKIDGTVRGFLVEKGTPGFSTANHMGKFSLRASVTSQLFFEDCRIPAENVLPKYSTLRRSTRSRASSSAGSPSPHTSSCRTNWPG